MSSLMSVSVLVSGLLTQVLHPLTIIICIVTVHYFLLVDDLGQASHHHHHYQQYDTK